MFFWLKASGYISYLDWVIDKPIAVINYLYFLC